MSFSYDSYNKFSSLMIDYNIEKLEGSHDDFKIFQNQTKPSNIMLIGNLTSKFREDQISKSTVQNNSISVKFLLKDFHDSILVDVNSSIFYRVYPSFYQQKEFLKRSKVKIEEDKFHELAVVWKRKDISFNSIELNGVGEKDLSFDNIIKEIKDDPDYFRGTKLKDNVKNISNKKKDSRKIIEGKFLKDEKSFNEFLSLLKHDFDPVDGGWDCSLSLGSDKFTQNNTQLDLINISLINNTEVPEDKNLKFNFESFIFNCKLVIKLKNNEIVPFDYEYKYENYYKKYSSDTRCLNTHAAYFNESNENEIKTRNYAEFSQEKILPRNSLDNLELSFEILSEPNETFKILEQIETKMENHYKNCLDSGNSNKEYKDNLKSFKNSIEKFSKGIESLKSSDNTLRAFNLLNIAFLRNSKYPSWRLFQLVFIISNIPDIVDPSKGNDVCELLHVMTGGGKSEAYFGLVIFSAFYDRLIGKRFGISAWTKFPLRMLSIQQLQRIANLFIFAEEVRLENNIEGDPFSIAYFVGNTDEFPKENDKIIAQIIEAKTKNKSLPGKIIDICPICGEKVVLDYEEDKQLVVHRCNNCEKNYYLFYTDYEIYRVLPTFIVSTVDKLAGIASQRKIKNLLGAKIDKCPEGHGFIPRGEVCGVDTEDGKCDLKGISVNIDFSTAPRLIIQDEMHLIKESFGTIDSHFESLYDAMINEFTGGNLKYIAMTATVTQSNEQIKHLYHKKTNIFPTKLLNEKGNDFFFEHVKENGDNVIQRNIIGLKPNFRDTRNATMQNLKYCSEFLYKVNENLQEFGKNNGFDISELKEILYNFKTILNYNNKKNDVQWMNHYYDDFVNSKGILIPYLSNVLTGDSSLDNIKESINQIETFNKPDKLLVTFSTNVVSHGVDIDRWNIIMFQGMPRNTAEYIQALSRVSRKYPGIVFVWHYPTKTRDLSFYQKFEDYHTILDHKVEGTPISRWAKLGFKQTFTSIFIASVINYLSGILETPIYRLEQFKQLLSVEENKNDIIRFIRKAYISNSSMLGSNFYNEHIKEEFDERIDYLLNYEGGLGISFFPKAFEDSDNKYFKTQFGMRGIQDEVCLFLDRQDSRFYNLW